MKKFILGACIASFALYSCEKEVITQPTENEDPILIENQIPESFGNTRNISKVIAIAGIEIEIEFGERQTTLWTPPDGGKPVYVVSECLGGSLWPCSIKIGSVNLNGSIFINEDNQLLLKVDDGNLDSENGKIWISHDIVLENTITEIVERPQNYTITDGHYPVLYTDGRAYIRLD